MSLPHVIAPAALQRQPGLMHRQGGRPAWMARPAAPVRLQRRARPTQCQSHPAAGPAALLQRAQAGALQAGLPALAALVLACQPAAAVETVQGPARTVDGDTLEVAGTRIRLYGVDAPETKQSCQRGGREYACGLDAKAALEARIGQAPVVCEVKNKDLYGRSVAVCEVAGARGGNLNAFMVESGNAVAYRQYSKEYVPLEEQAQAAKRGIWAGSFQEPAQWRKDHPRTGAASDTKLLPAPSAAIAALPAPSLEATKRVPPSPSCQIKGNINAKGEKIYHVPGGRSYDATDIDLAAGERWFCNEKEAQEAGWRRSKV